MLNWYSPEFVGIESGAVFEREEKAIISQGFLATGVAGQHKQSAGITWFAEIRVRKLNTASILHPQRPAHTNYTHSVWDLGLNLNRYGYISYLISIPKDSIILLNEAFRIVKTQSDLF